MHSEQQYIEFFNNASYMIRSKSCEAMNACREEAFQQFKTLGFPSQKVERYKYTDVDKAFQPNYGIMLAPYLPYLKPSPYLLSLKDARQEIAYAYNTIADNNDPLTLFNTMLAHECIVVNVGKNIKVDEPIAIDWMIGGEIVAMQVRRLLIIMEEGAEATIIINDRAKHNQQFLTSQVIEINCASNSHLDIYDIEDTVTQMNRFSNTYANIGNDCTFRHNNITLFNGTSRNLCDVRMMGRNSEATLNGCAIAAGTQHIDNNTLIDHQSGFCRSNELYKYVVDDNAVGAFAGRILVEKDAQKTESQETNNNLCASTSARMYTQPMLEIYADDVKCAHGSTVGVMDEAALFYMRQRGIDEEEARTLLKNAFMGQVIDQIDNENLRNKLSVKIEKRFRGELEKCETCRLCK